MFRFPSLPPGSRFLPVQDRCIYSTVGSPKCLLMPQGLGYMPPKENTDAKGEHAKERWSHPVRGQFNKRLNTSKNSQAMASRAHGRAGYTHHHTKRRHAKTIKDTTKKKTPGGYPRCRGRIFLLPLPRASRKRKRERENVGKGEKGRESVSGTQTDPPLACPASTTSCSLFPDADEN